MKKFKVKFLPPLTMNDCQERIDSILERITAAESSSGRPNGTTTLLAVSKTVPPERISMAVDAGLTVFGESKVQEAAAKIPSLPNRLSWHFIGHLQTNKIRKALPLFSCYHSIDSLKLAGALNTAASEAALFPRVYLQVNLWGEHSKFGFSEINLKHDFEALLALNRIHIEGLMAIPPPRENPLDTRADFARMREFRDTMETFSGVPLPGLSMGMSHDFEIAIAEGSTIVRIGSAIFGERKHSNT